MNRNRYAPTLDRLEPRALLSAGNPLDPTMPPPGPTPIIIIHPVLPRSPLGPPGLVIA